MRTVLLIALASFAVPALAQVEPRPPPPAAQPGRHHDFGDQRLAGEREGPGGSYTLGRRKSVFPNLIRVRSSFADKIDESVDAL